MEKQNSKQKGILFLCIGAILLIIGLYLQFSGNSEAVNQANLEIATHATSAEEAARQISANNRGEVGGNMLSMFLIGIGGALTLFSILILAKKAK